MSSATLQCSNHPVWRLLIGLSCSTNSRSHLTHPLARTVAPSCQLPVLRERSQKKNFTQGLVLLHLRLHPTMARPFLPSHVFQPWGQVSESKRYLLLLMTPFRH